MKLFCLALHRAFAEYIIENLDQEAGCKSE